MNGTPPSGIGSLHYQSQDVKPGGLFVAIPGHTTDGHDFIDEALQKGGGFRHSNPETN